MQNILLLLSLINFADAVFETKLKKKKLATNSQVNAVLQRASKNKNKIKKYQCLV